MFLDPIEPTFLGVLSMISLYVLKKVSSLGLRFGLKLTVIFTGFRFHGISLWG